MDSKTSAVLSALAGPRDLTYDEFDSMQLTHVCAICQADMLLTTDRRVIYCKFCIIIIPTA